MIRVKSHLRLVLFRKSIYKKWKIVLIGGPLLYTERTEQNQILYQIGITSYGQYCAVSPSVSTRVTTYLDWITSVTPNANYCIQ